MPSNTEQSWDGWTKKKGRKGRPRFPKLESKQTTTTTTKKTQQHWFPFHALLNSVEPCLELFPLCTVPLWDLSLHMKTHAVLYVFISGDVLLHCKCREGGRCAGTRPFTEKTNRNFLRSRLKTGTCGVTQSLLSHSD